MRELYTSRAHVLLRSDSRLLLWDVLWASGTLFLVAGVAGVGHHGSLPTWLMNWHSQEWQGTKRNKSMMINAAADDANFRQESCPGLTKPPPATYPPRRMSPCARCAGRKALPRFLSCWVSEVPCVWQPLLGNKNQADLNQFIYNQSQPFPNSWTLHIAPFFGAWHVQS